MGHYRPLNHLAEWEIRLVCPIQPNFFIEANPNPFYQEITYDMRLILTHSIKKFLVIRDHLLPLTNYLVNGQYAQVQPIASKFAERSI